MICSDDKRVLWVHFEDLKEQREREMMIIHNCRQIKNDSKQKLLKKKF
jgi:hypothetical protein